MEDTVRLPVRGLVEFLLRSGSLDNRFGGTERAQEGSRIHRRLQKEAGDGYQPEVFLSHTATLNGIVYRIEGRADGVFREGEEVYIDEIKTTRYPLSLLHEDFCREHWGQAMCYAYFYALQNSLERISAQLTYYQVDEEAVVRYRRSFTLMQLSAFFDDLLHQYEKWARLQQDWLQIRSRSLGELVFPFPCYRPGQREMAVAVYRTICAGGRLFCQAPTGIGKSISALFPALKAMGEGMAERVFYLTAKTITRYSAQDALSQMRQKGLQLRSVTLTAKDKICFLEQRDCNPENCPYAEGYYDRISGALYSLLTSQENFTRESIEAAARENRVCPFELSLELSNWSDLIICDYNYLFDPVASLKRFFSEEGSNYIFLIDEAHNLVDRAREMYSASLQKSSFLEQMRELRGERPLHRALSRVNRELLALRREAENEGGAPLILKEPPKPLLEALRRCAAQCEDWLAQNRTHPGRSGLLALYFEVQFFLRIAEGFDSCYAALAIPHGSDALIRLFCLDPSRLLDASLKYGRSAIFFSATLSPPEYFVSVLGGSENAKKYLLPSPFPPQNLCIALAHTISTRYRDREQSLSSVTELLHAFVSVKAGNYIAYFPSYPYLQAAYHQFTTTYPDIPVLLQSSGMSEEEREAVLDRFAPGSSQTLLGFCVLGGIYSEGVDLSGDRLIGAAVVGVGLPQISFEQDLLRDYYDRLGPFGFDFAYRYPGMNKVLQAAGRVIRSENDRGALLLIDSRFLHEDYRRLLPSHWSHLRTVRGPGELSALLGRFWDSQRQESSPLSNHP